MLLSEGQMSDYKGAALMIDALPRAKVLLADRGYDADWFRAALAARDIAACRHAWERAQALMADPTIRLIVLDELNIALRYDYLDLEGVVATLRARRPDLHVVVTGRNAKPMLIEAADLVTEMGSVKHHFAAGVKAQEGIEF